MGGSARGFAGPWCYRGWNVGVGGVLPAARRGLQGHTQGAVPRERRLLSGGLQRCLWGREPGLKGAEEAAKQSLSKSSYGAGLCWDKGQKGGWRRSR